MDGVAAASWETLRVSRPGTLTAVKVAIGGADRFIAVSVYAAWERPLGAAG